MAAAAVVSRRAIPEAAAAAGRKVRDAVLGHSWGGSAERHRQDLQTRAHDLHMSVVIILLL